VNRAAGEPVRILGLVEGDPSSALSGVGHYLLEALDRRFSVTGTVDYAPHGAVRIAIAAATFRPSRAAWRARFHTSRLAHRMLSRTLRGRLAEFEGDFDLALQVHGWVDGQPHPYALFVDQTRLMAERGWPEWMPFTAGERDELLALERRMYAGAVHLFAMGGPARDSLLADYGVDAERATVVGGGLDFEAMPEAAGPGEEPRILFVGRDFERKGGHVLVRAFERVHERIPEAELEIVGAARGFDVPGITSYGKISDREQLRELYRGARVFCLPSLYEPYGLVLIEAMAHGVPCVGSAVQAIPEILDDGRAGLLVPPNDAERLAEALLRLLTHDGLARDLGAAGRLRVGRELTWDRVAERMAPALERAAGRA
jgi:starch synthase